MPEKIKTKRRYNSTRRQAQAARTRRHIVEAARRLFAGRGYTGTTMEAIAQEAGVATETIYATFGSKRAVLSGLIDVSVVGDDKPVPLLERSGPRAVKQEPNQHRQLRLFAHDIHLIMERMSPIFEIMRAAAKTEPDIAALLQQLLEKRRQGMAQFVQYLAQNGPLRQGLSLSEAADTVWALTGAEVYRLLTTDREWSGDRYETWLGDTLTLLLLPCDESLISKENGD